MQAGMWPEHNAALQVPLERGPRTNRTHCQESLTRYRQVLAWNTFSCTIPLGPRPRKGTAINQKLKLPWSGLQHTANALYPHDMPQLHRRPPQAAPTCGATKSSCCCSHTLVHTHVTGAHSAYPGAGCH